MFDHLRRQSAEAAKEGTVAVLDRLQFLNPEGVAKAEQDANLKLDAELEQGHNMAELLAALQVGGEAELPGGQVNAFAHSKLSTIIFDVSTP